MLALFIFLTFTANVSDPKKCNMLTIYKDGTVEGEFGSVFHDHSRLLIYPGAVLKGPLCINARNVP